MLPPPIWFWITTFAVLLRRVPAAWLFRGERSFGATSSDTSGNPQPE